jgi:hypothetical membrane protein
LKRASFLRSRVERRACPAITIASALVPLVCIAAAALSSGWFNLLNNALSDLGHAVRSNVAPIFNFGLSAGGLLIALAGACSLGRSRAIGWTLVVAGYFLILIAVFDEVYGRLHFYVSVAFFLSIAVLLAEYALTVKGVKGLLAPLAIAVGVAAWVAHMVYGLPRGAAVPELISIFIALPFYLDFTLSPRGAR